MNYYNEFDKYPAQWLRNLIENNQIPKGNVDERSINEVNPDDLKQFIQSHFFAGIGGWSYALRLAGWPENVPVWTGSCPCQPFSSAGKRKGINDERHLWPAFRWLISQCRPPVIFGEQVASKDGRLWLAGVRSDLEAMGYEVGAADLCAASVGAPHIRQRLFWVAYAGHERRKHQTKQKRRENDHGHYPSIGLANSDKSSQHQWSSSWQQQIRDSVQKLNRLGNTNEQGLQGRIERQECSGEVIIGPASAWSEYLLIPCIDGKARRLKPGLMPLAHGVPCRMGAIKGYGNAIVPQIAAEFIKSFMEYV